MGRQADMVRDLLLRAVSVLEQGGVSYALCGGWAVALWGYPRMTTDIDIVLAEDEMDSAREALREAGFTLEAGRIPLPSQGIWFHRVSALVEDELVPMDIYPVARDHPYLLNKARAEWQGTSFPVLDIEDLIHMKSKSERGKDKVDVEELRRIRDEKNPG